MISRLSQALNRRGLSGAVALAASRSHIGAHARVAVEMVRRPRHAGPWIVDRFRPKTPLAQARPWIAMACVDFLDSYVKPGHRVLEYGGGGSTLYFLSRGCSLATVESSEEWSRDLAARVDTLAPNFRTNWDLRYVPAQDNSDPAIADYVAQARSGGPWDVILVDGWARMKCLLAARKYVAVGGAIILDNADQDQFSDVPRLMGGWERHAFKGLGVARSWTTQTDAYIRQSHRSRFVSVLRYEHPASGTESQIAARELL